MSLEALSVFQNSSQQLEETFKSVSQKVCMMFALEGLHLKPYVDGLPYFKALSQPQKEDIVENLKFFSELCEQQITEGYRLRDNSSFTWRAFRKLGLIPCSDVFTYMSDEDLVEIYSTENKQIYRNFRFFECCSYTLEELYSVEWFHLYERDAKMTMKIFEAGAKVASGEIQGSYVPEVGPHLLKEIRSDEKKLFRQQVKLISPLKRNKAIEALLVIETADLVNN